MLSSVPTDRIILNAGCECTAYAGCVMGWDFQKESWVANIRFQGLRPEVLSGSFLPTMCEINKTPFLKGTKLSL